MKKIVSALLSFLFIFSLCVPVRAEETPDGVRTIRVGLVKPVGQQNDFAYQMLASYLCGYLDEVSKQTHWQYSYVTGSYRECRERLLRGELDFVAPVQSGQAAGDGTVMTGVPCCTLLHLYRRGDEPRRPMTPETVNGAVIGFLENEENRTALSYYLEKNGWQVELRAFQDPSVMLAALYNREINAVCDDGSHVTDDERHVVSFAVVSAKLMTTPDKAALSEELTGALLAIDTLNPGFVTNLKAEYIDRALQTIVHPTETERQFIENIEELRVVFLPNFAPLYDVKGKLEDSEGLYIDFLKLLSNISGMHFSLLRAASEEEVWQMLDDGRADLAFVAYQNGRAPMKMRFTGDFRKEEYSVVRRRDGAVEKGGKGVVAVPSGFPGAAQVIGQRRRWRTRTFATVDECLDAVATGAYEAAVIPSIYLRRENSLVLRSDLEAVNGEEVLVPLSLAISPRQPQILQSVLDTEILRMNKVELARLAQENATPHFSLEYLLHRYPLQMALLLCLLIAGVAATVFSLYRSRLQKKQNQVLQQKNRELEAALANVEAMRISRDGYKLDSETDKLTAAFNKAGFEYRAREQLSTLSGKGAALYIIDLDHFKEANDTYGHQCGDEILQNFAKALKCVFRQSDCVGRFGGDEFMVLIEGALTREVVERKAMHILEAARTLGVEGKDIHVTASVGIAIMPEHGTVYDELFKVADKALYRVKSEGRDGYSIASEDVVR